MDDITSGHILNIRARRLTLELKIPEMNRRIKLFESLTLVLVLTGIVFFLIAWPTHLYPYFLKFNELGDFIAGTSGAIWALAGVVLIYQAFLGQRLQILQQQIEMTHSQEEIAILQDQINSQKQSLEKQINIATKQGQDSNLYPLIQLYKDSRAKIYIGTNGTHIDAYKGEEGIRCVRVKVLDELNAMDGYNRDLCRDAITKVMGNYFGPFRNYHMHIGLILRFINEVSKVNNWDINNPDFQRFINTLISQFSDDECALLCFYGDRCF